MLCGYSPLIWSYLQYLRTVGFLTTGLLSFSLFYSLHCYTNLLTLVLLNLDITCLCKQYRSRSVGFWRSQLIWICTVCHLVCEFVTTTWNGRKLDVGVASIYSAGQGLITWTESQQNQQCSMCNTGKIQISWYIHIGWSVITKHMTNPPTMKNP